MWYFSCCDDDLVHKMRPSFRKMVCGMIAPESQTSCWRHCRFMRIWRFGRPALGDHRTDREGLQEPWQIPHCMPACSKRISGISALMAVPPKDHLHWLRQQGRSEVRSDPITEYWKGWTAEAHHQGGRVMWQGQVSSVEDSFAAACMCSLSLAGDNTSRLQDSREYADSVPCWSFM